MSLMARLGRGSIRKVPITLFKDGSPVGFGGLSLAVDRTADFAEHQEMTPLDLTKGTVVTATFFNDQETAAIFHGGSQNNALDFKKKLNPGDEEAMSFELAPGETYWLAAEGATCIGLYEQARG